MLLTSIIIDNYGYYLFRVFNNYILFLYMCTSRYVNTYLRYITNIGIKPGTYSEVCNNLKEASSSISLGIL